MKNEDINDMLNGHIHQKWEDVEPKDVGDAGSSLVKLIQVGIKIWKDLMK